jgi:hypothetical protein
MSEFFWGICECCLFVILVSEISIFATSMQMKKTSNLKKKACSNALEH